jgi:hypothetical protein
MDLSPLQPPPGENFRAEERARRRNGVVLAVIGALLMALAVLDGWPAM